MILAHYILRHELKASNISVAKMSRSLSTLDGTSSLNTKETFSLTSISAAKVNENLPMLDGTSALKPRTAQEVSQW